MSRFPTPETRFFSEQKWPALSESEAKLHSVIVPEYEKSRIDPRKFIDLYGSAAVEMDLKEIQSLEAQFSGDGDPDYTSHVARGALFEAILSDQIESSDWLGKNARVIVPSRYDDIKHGIDGIIEFEEETGKSHLAIGVDITKGSEWLDKKFAFIKSSIDRGELSKVKYFKTGDYRGELRMVPRVIIGAGQKVSTEVAELLLDFKQIQKRLLSPREKEAVDTVTEESRTEFKHIRGTLENHILQFIILYEMKAQLEAFQKYAERTGKNNVASAYRKRLDIIEGILQNKLEGTNRPKIEAKMEKDSVYRMIREKTARFAG